MGMEGGGGIFCLSSFSLYNIQHWENFIIYYQIRLAAFSQMWFLHRLALSRCTLACFYHLNVFARFCAAAFPHVKAY